MVLQFLTMSFDSQGEASQEQSPKGKIKENESQEEEAIENEGDESTNAEPPPSPPKVDDVVDPNFEPLPSPTPPEETPERFLKAGKGDLVEGHKRYQATLAWRQEHNINGCLQRGCPNFELINSNYPHYYHLRGKNNEPIFYEQPPKTNLKAMKDAGITIPELLNYYAMVTEFQWQYIERSDHAQSIYVLDLEGIGIFDFVGECVDYVKKSAEFTGSHYPERAAYIFIVNVPGWFQVIWDVLKPLVDEVTLEKITILSDKDKAFEAMNERIPIENIPPEYGGTCEIKLGKSPEEQLLKDLMYHNNCLVTGDLSCGGRNGNCQFCNFVPVRSY